MSWLWPEYVDRDLQLSREQRKAVHRDAWKLWTRDKKNIALYLMVPIVYLTVVPFASDLGGRFASLLGVTGTLHVIARAAAPVLLAVGCFVFGGSVLQRFRFGPCVYQALQQHDHDVCARCGFWLRGLPTEVEKCPECGEAR